MTVRTRPDISMSSDEIRAFLATQDHGVVVALDAGAPVGTVAPIRLVDGMLRVTVDPGDPVAALLAGDPRVCVIAEQFPHYYEIKGVAAHGIARPSAAAGATFTLSLDDVTSFDFAKLPRHGAGSGRGDAP